ncbi:MAG: hypothetical protein GX811_06535 [Lentisphaerae bacterium]|nr:hypothetical protein [Lentisphaerota bacterium]
MSDKYDLAQMLREIAEDKNSQSENSERTLSQDDIKKLLEETRKNKAGKRANGQTN